MDRGSGRATTLGCQSGGLVHGIPWLLSRAGNTSWCVVARAHEASIPRLRSVVIDLQRGADVDVVHSAVSIARPNPLELGLWSPTSSEGVAFEVSGRARARGPSRADSPRPTRRSVGTVAQGRAGVGKEGLLSSEIRSSSQAFASRFSVALAWPRPRSTGAAWQEQECRPRWRRGLASKASNSMRRACPEGREPSRLASASPAR